MDITITTPALLFPSVTFLLIAYTNRFLALGSRIRKLHERYQNLSDEKSRQQIASLRRRVSLIRNMQACAVSGLFLCVFCMLLLFVGFAFWGKVAFLISVVLIMASLALSLREIFLSMDALDLELSDMAK